MREVPAPEALSRETPRSATGRRLALLPRRASQIHVAWVEEPGRRTFLSVWLWNFDPATDAPYPDKAAGVRVHVEELPQLRRAVAEGLDEAQRRRRERER